MAASGSPGSVATLDIVSVVLLIFFGAFMEGSMIALKKISL